MPRVRRSACSARRAVHGGCTRRGHRATRRGRTADGSLRVPIDGRAQRPARHRHDGHGGRDAATLVTARRAGVIEIPFFGWFFRPLTRIAGNRSARVRDRVLCATISKAARTEGAVRPVIGLPNVPFSREQSTAARLRRRPRSRSSRSRARCSGSSPIRSAMRSASRTPSSASRSRSRGVGALVAIFATALADRRGRRRVDPARRRRLGARVRGVGHRADDRDLHRRADAAARVRQHDAHRRRHRGDRRGARRRAGLSRRRCWRSPAASASRSPSSRSRSPTSATTAGASRTSLGALTIFLARAHRARPGRDDALQRSRCGTESSRGRLRELLDPRYGRRFALLAIVGFLANVFNAPSSQLMNKYLSDVRDFSNSGIALFRTVTTALPGLIGLVMGGRLAEATRPQARRDRRAADRDVDADGVLPLRRHRCSGSPPRCRSSRRPRPASRSAPSTRSCSPPSCAARRTRCSLIVSVLGSVAGLVDRGHAVGPARRDRARRSRSAGSRAGRRDLLRARGSPSRTTRRSTRSVRPNARDEYGPRACRNLTSVPRRSGVPGGAALARRPAVLLGHARPPRRRGRPGRERRDDRRGPEPAVRARLAARRPHARRVDARPEGAAPRGRRRSSSTPTCRRSRPRTATTWSSTRTGRAYVGNFGFDMYGGEQSRETNAARGRARRPRVVAADDLSFPNGTVITARRPHADRRREHCGRPHRVRHRRRRHAVEPPGAGHSSRARRDADGICLDAEGAIWVACPSTGRCVRVAEGGELLDEVRRRGRGTFACMLGGADRRTLFICTADAHEPECAHAPRSGRIEAVEVDTPGA